MSIEKISSAHVSRMCEKLNYHGDDQKTLGALGRLFPITWEMANPAHIDDVGDIRVFDDFIAVVDGRIDLKAAFENARRLIQKPQFKSVVIIRDQDTISKSLERVKSAFNREIFGNTARSGTVLTFLQQHKFMLERLRPMTSLLSSRYMHSGHNFLTAARIIGRDFNDVFKAARQQGAFPEFLSWRIVNQGDTSKPGILHADPALIAPGYERHIQHLPQSFMRAAAAESFVPLDGNIAMTVALNGQGTILARSEGAHLKQRDFMEAADVIGYQAENGSVTIVRGEGWTNEVESGLSRDPAYHCSPFMNPHGVVGKHAGRVVAGASKHSCYLSPLLYKRHGWDMGSP